MAKIIESTGDPKKLWNITKQLLHSKSVSLISDDECVMSNAFCQIFINNIAGIRRTITEIMKTFDGSSHIFRPFVGLSLNAFTNVC